MSMGHWTRKKGVSTSVIVSICLFFTVIISQSLWTTAHSSSASTTNSLLIHVNDDNWNDILEGEWMVEL